MLSRMFRLKVDRKAEDRKAEDRKDAARRGVMAFGARPPGEAFIASNLTTGAYTDTRGNFNMRDFIRDRRIYRDYANIYQQSVKKAQRLGKDEHWTKMDALKKLEKLTEWKDTQAAPKKTQISVGEGSSSRAYRSADAAIRDRHNRISVARNLRNLKNNDNETYASLEDLTKRRAATISKIAEFTDPKKGYIGSSLSQVRAEGYAAHLQNRKLKEAENQRTVQDKLGNGKAITSTPGLVAYDLYGKPVAPVDPLKNFHGTMSNKDRSALAQKHAMAQAAYRTAISQWNQENPNLVGRDVASLDRGTYAMSAENRAREAIALGNQKLLQGMTSELNRQNKAIDSANFLTARGYAYNDKEKQWEKANG